MNTLAWILGASIMLAPAGAALAADNVAPAAVPDAQASASTSSTDALDRPHVYSAANMQDNAGAADSASHKPKQRDLKTGTSRDAG